MAGLEAGRDGELVGFVARDRGVGWGTVMRAVSENAHCWSTLGPGLAGVATLGVDETAHVA